MYNEWWGSPPKANIRFGPMTMFDKTFKRVGAWGAEMNDRCTPAGGGLTQQIHPICFHLGVSLPVQRCYSMVETADSNTTYCRQAMAGSAHPLLHSKAQSATRAPTHPVDPTDQMAPIYVATQACVWSTHSFGSLRAAGAIPFGHPPQNTREIVEKMPNTRYLA